MTPTPNPPWLHHYANKTHYQWRTLQHFPRPTSYNHHVYGPIPPIPISTSYYRPLGLVESTFDTDGRHFTGRADLNAQLEVEVRISAALNPAKNPMDFRQHLLFAWACLRTQHLLLQARALMAEEMPTSAVGGEREGDVFFVVQPGTSVSEAIEGAGRELCFLQDWFKEGVDAGEFWVHCQNVGRLVGGEGKALTRVFVLPLEHEGVGEWRGMLKFLFIGAHQIWDGLANYVFFRDFVKLLNLNLMDLKARLRELLRPEGMLERLPPPQEALYPPIPGSRARQRWFWLLTRILRHVRRPLPAGFENPLLRRRPREKAIALSPIYDPLLDYTIIPPLNSLPCFAKASQKGTQRLHRICKEGGASVGAGCFALAALVMMEFYERREPDVPLEKRKPFISGFPLNPRAFFDHHTEPNSLMLAFCDGILLPFLPSDLDFEGRLRLLARSAHRQLGVFQKRKGGIRSVKEGAEFWGSRGPGRLLQIQYLGSLERQDVKRPTHMQSGLNPQGAFPARQNATMQTCGVSSVGRREALIKPGEFDLEEMGGKEFVADFRACFATVRPRDGEFLVGCGGSDLGLWLNASCDGCAMDPALMDEWTARWASVLDVEGMGKGREE